MKRKVNSKDGKNYKQRRISVGYQQKKDWEHRMDGFQGFDFEASQRNKMDQFKKKSSKQSGIKGSSEQLASLSDLEDTVRTESQVDIKWTQSDEEEVEDEDKVPRTSASRPGRLKPLVTSAAATLFTGYKNYLQEDEVNISLCPSQSPTAVHGTANNSDHVQGVTICSQTISSEGSSPKTGLDEGDGQRSSDWVKGLQWQAVTPEKDEGATPATLGESTRKKRAKFKQGSLAERMQTLIAREKSSKAVWAHRKHKENKASDKVLCVRVVDCDSKNSLLVCHCDMLSHSADSSSVTVLFHKQYATDSLISTGAVINIHPPWQKMQGSYRNDGVILCTQFFTVETPGVPQTNHTDEDSRKAFPNWTETADWKCPCLSDTQMNPEDCPAQNNPYLPTVPHGCTEGSAGMTLVSANLSTVDETPQHVKNHQPSSILDAIASCGGCHGSGVNFKVTIQRTYKDHHAESGRCVLVQDKFGTFAQLHLPDKLIATNENMAELEGRELLCKGLRVQDRLNRDRNEELFHLIHSVSRPEKYMNKMDSQSSCQSTENEVGPPNFIYRLSTESGSCKLVTSQTCDLYCPAEIQPLSSLVTNQLSCCTTILAKFLYRYNCHPESFGVTDLPDSWHELFILTDNSIRASSDSPNPTTVCLVIGNHGNKDLASFRTNDVMYLKDAYWCKGRLHIASFTEVRRISSNGDNNNVIEKQLIDELLMLRPLFPTFSSDSTLYSIVTVQGCVEDVDEGSAFMWMECNRCGNQDLTNRHTNNLFLFCGQCQRGVEEPATKIKLQVYLSTYSNVRLKIQLLQPTIESLLPEEADEEGYELQAVLGKPLSSLYCIVLKKSLQKDTKETHYLLEQIDLS